jgi:2-keto-3-deoxy-L-fuconate dehydrogenase
VADGQLQGKIALITGATSGIGRAAAVRFAQAGASVVVAGRDEERGAAVVEEIGRDTPGEAIFAQADVADPAEVEGLVARAEAWRGRLDIAYQSAGVMATGTAPATSLETWRQTIEVNLSGPFYLAKYAIPALGRAGGGVVLLTASELGTVGAAETVAYCAAKGGVINMVRALAIDCAPLGIRVVGLAPGPIETPMLRNWIDGAADPAAAEAAQTSPVLMKRYGRPEEIADAALFLASGAASYMTGATLVVDGGATAWYGM